MPLTILLIEDDPSTLEALKDWFSGCGYNCRSAIDIATARATLRQLEAEKLKIDAIITDCCVPLGEGSFAMTVAPQALVDQLEQLANCGTRIIVTSVEANYRRDASQYLHMRHIPHAVVPKNFDRITEALLNRHVA